MYCIRSSFWHQISQNDVYVDHDWKTLNQNTLIYGDLICTSKTVMLEPISESHNKGLSDPTQKIVQLSNEITGWMRSAFSIRHYPIHIFAGTDHTAERQLTGWWWHEASTAFQSVILLTAGCRIQRSTQCEAHTEHLVVVLNIMLWFFENRILIWFLRKI